MLGIKSIHKLVFMASVYIFVFSFITLYAHVSGKQSIKLTLLDQLPKQFERALVNAHDKEALYDLSAKSLMKQLNPLSFNTPSRLSLINQAVISDLSFPLHQHDKLSSIIDSHQQISWPYASGSIQLNYHLKFSYHWLTIASISLLISIVLFYIEKILPSKNKQKQMQWHYQLVSQEFSDSEAEILSTIIPETPFYQNLLEQISSLKLSFDDVVLLVKHDKTSLLTTNEIAWLLIALKQNLTVENAIAVAHHKNNLTFDLPNSQVIIHGLEIHIAQTSLFYYYWYAKRKIIGQQGYISPPQNIPDNENALAIAKIMEQNLGHQKAINHLLTEGLKGKTLDQNRNKIKIELQQVLGIDFAEAYLFDSFRDEKTARYQYSLSLDAELINLSI